MPQKRTAIGTWKGPEWSSSTHLETKQFLGFHVRLRGCLCGVLTLKIGEIRISCDTRPRENEKTDPREDNSEKDQIPLKPKFLQGGAQSHQL